MYMINFIIMYDVVNLFSIVMYKSSRKLRVGVNRYTGVNWSTTTMLCLLVYFFNKHFITESYLDMKAIFTSTARKQ